MPRKRRFFLPDVPTHVVQRGNNHQAVFFDDDDYRAYLNWLGGAASANGCAIHAYALMTNHVHLLVTPSERDAVSATLQDLGRHYVPYINRCYQRTGTLWEGRFRASMVQEEDYLLTCYCYIELNPVRAAMVELPEDYPWSSYRANAMGAADPLVTAHPLYLALGATPEARREAYRAIFATHLDPDLVRDLRACLQTGTPLGNDRFRAQIEQALGVKVGHSTRGRPRKPPEDSPSREEQIEMKL